MMNTVNNLSPYEQWQGDRYGNVIPDTSHIPESELFENGIAELERLAEYMDRESEKVLLEYSL